MRCIRDEALKLRWPAMLQVLQIMNGPFIKDVATNFSMVSPLIL